MLKQLNRLATTPFNAAAMQSRSIGEIESDDKSSHSKSAG
jgi:hypothetical protein